MFARKCCDLRQKTPRPRQACANHAPDMRQTCANRQRLRDLFAKATSVLFIEQEVRFLPVVLDPRVNAAIWSTGPGCFGPQMPRLTSPHGRQSSVCPRFTLLFRLYRIVQSTFVLFDPRVKSDPVFWRRLEKHKKSKYGFVDPFWVLASMDWSPRRLQCLGFSFLILYFWFRCPFGGSDAPLGGFR